MVFLAINGHTPKVITDDAIVELGLGVADNRITDEEVREWFLKKYPTAEVIS